MDTYNKILKYSKPIFYKGYTNTRDLAVIMLPIVFILKILQELNLVYYLVHPFNPVMSFLGLPDVYALVWLGAILNTNYTAFFLTLALFPTAPITYEQVTVLAVLCLLAHSLITEGFIISKFHTNTYFVLFARIATALILAFVTHKVFSIFNIGQNIVSNSIVGTKNVVIEPTFMDLYKQIGLAGNYSHWFLGILKWAFTQIRLFVLIYVVIVVLFFVIQFIKDANLAGVISNVVGPLTKSIGIKKDNNLVLMLCYIIGLSYGFGLLKEEYENNKNFSKDQSFKVLLFVAISHAMIEDSLIFIFLGANAWVVVLGRTLMSFIAVYLVFLMLKNKKIKNKYYKIFYKE